uniref:Ribosome biogenesis protein NOP53 n=1 Tax=Amphimedon queenslandica TaxID=400682 RepID=A0A1X7UD66_AMPQE
MSLPFMEQWMVELSQGLDEASSSDDDDAIDDIPVNVRPPARKTNKQRRKERLIRKTALLHKAMKREKMRMSDVYRIKSLKKEIAAKEHMVKEKMLKRLHQKQSKLTATRRIGKYKYEKPPVDVQLSSELCGSLRLLQGRGDFITDRYKSLQKRNMVEPKGPPMKSRYRKHPRVKWTESRSYELRTL